MYRPGSSNVVAAALSRAPVDVALPVNVVATVNTVASVGMASVADHGGSGRATEGRGGAEKPTTGNEGQVTDEEVKAGKRVTRQSRS